MKLYINTNGTVQGPIEFETIIKTVEAGFFSKDATVSVDKESWLSLEEAKERFGNAPEAPKKLKLRVAQEPERAESPQPQPIAPVIQEPPPTVPAQDSQSDVNNPPAEDKKSSKGSKIIGGLILIIIGIIFIYFNIFGETSPSDIAKKARKEDLPKLFQSESFLYNGGVITDLKLEKKEKNLYEGNVTFTLDGQTRVRPIAVKIKENGEYEFGIDFDYADHDEYLNQDAKHIMGNLLKANNVDAEIVDTQVVEPGVFKAELKIPKGFNRIVKVRVKKEGLNYEYEVLNDSVVLENPMLSKNIELELVYVEAGTFMMGNTSGDKGYVDEIRHEVTLTDDFFIGKYEVTQEQYKAVMGTNPSRFKEGGRHPVYDVSWYDAREFCKKLTKQERDAGRIPEDYIYDLPTEAQWEYAAKGGNKSKNYTYSGSNTADKVAWYYVNAGNSYLNDSTWRKNSYTWQQNHNSTHPVGKKAPNELGLYDMTGNVYEWCRDNCVFDEQKQQGVLTSTYLKGSVTNPWETYGNERIIRGGSYIDCAMRTRNSFRTCYRPDSLQITTGFRVALVPLIK